MKNIFLKSLELRNFKGIRSINIEFQDMNTSILGENGVGKTTIFDAFTWLLFGKDSQGNSKFEIKTLDQNGNVLEKLDHYVVGVLVIDGQPVELKRNYVENWVKRRGSNDTELKGHNTEYFIDDVPKKMNEYNAFISNIIDENIFKLLTNPSHFPNLNWKEQREILFDIAGDIDQQEIIKKDQDFKDLFDKLSGKSLEDYKKQLAAMRKKINDAIKDIPTRIDEAERSKPDAIDVEGVTLQIKAKEAKIEKLDKLISDQNERRQEVFKTHMEKREQINSLKLKQQNVINDAEIQASQEQSKKRTELSELNNRRHELERSLGYAESRADKIKADIERGEKAVNDLKEKFKSINAETYSGNDENLVCPLWKISCADPKSLELFERNNEQALAAFNEQKVEKLKTINQEGKSFSEALKKLNQELEENQTAMEGFLKELNEIGTTKDKIEIPTKKEVIPAELPEWVELDNQVEEISKTLGKVEFDGTDEYANEKKELLSELKELQAQLSTQDQIKRLNIRITDLKQEEKILAQQMSDLERDEYAIERFTKAKINLIESSINDKFDLVEFRLFETQVNGAEVETCKAQVNGVPYSDVNTAGKINAGIDIINALSKFYNCQAPIFIDHRESVNRLLDTESQIINLVVSNDNQITIK